MYDDDAPNGQDLAEDDALLEVLEESDEQDDNAHTLSIRRGGEEILTIFSPGEEWSAYLSPGGSITNAFLGAAGDPIVWVDANDRQVERDADGTYVIRID